MSNMAEIISRAVSTAGSMLATSLLALFMVIGGGWGVGALAYELPGPPVLRVAVALLWALAALVCMWLWFMRGSHLALAVFLVMLIGLLAWWSTLQPSHERDWADDVARMAQAQVQGERLIIDGVRNFEWRSETDYDIRWERREYRLDQLRSADLILSYWMGPKIAHTLVSFGFSDGQQLVLSVEIRKERHETFSSVGGFFRQFETVIIAADERDIVRVRHDVRGEDVYLFRLHPTPEQLRGMLLGYVAEMQALAEQPRFYNTLTSNCTTIVFNLARRLSTRMRLDYRLLLSGYLDEYVYDLGLMTPGFDFPTLKARGHITQQFLSPEGRADYSMAIRRELPGVAPPP